MCLGEGYLDGLERITKPDHRTAGAEAGTTREGFPLRLGAFMCSAQ